MKQLRVTIDWYFGPAIKTLREKKHWSQVQLAMKSGLTRSRIAMIETGKRKEPGATALCCLAKAFEISVDQLCEMAGNGRKCAR